MPYMEGIASGDGGVSRIDDIIADFDFIDDWEERYRYIIELGRALEPLPEADHIDAYKVRGCASQVWLVTHASVVDGETILTFQGDSDAHIVRGLVAIVIAIFSGLTADQIIATDPEPLFDQLQLREHITPQRSNGVKSMILRIKADAEAAVARYPAS
jgi:cysteine desulfuration protein SufE